MVPWLKERRRRYMDVPAGAVVPSRPAPSGSASIRLTVNVDIEAWAKAHGRNGEDAQRELSQRIKDAMSPVLSKLTTELGDMRRLIRSATISAG